MEGGLNSVESPDDLALVVGVQHCRHVGVDLRQPLVQLGTFKFLQLGYQVLGFVCSWFLLLRDTFHSHTVKERKTRSLDYTIIIALIFITRSLLDLILEIETEKQPN